MSMHHFYNESSKANKTKQNSKKYYSIYVEWNMYICTLDFTRI